MISIPYHLLESPTTQSLDCFKDLSNEHAIVLWNLASFSDRSCSYLECYAMPCLVSAISASLPVAAWRHTSLCVYSREFRCACEVVKWRKYYWIPQLILLLTYHTHTHTHTHMAVTHLPGVSEAFLFVVIQHALNSWIDVAVMHLNNTVGEPWVKRW